MNDADVYMEQEEGVTSYLYDIKPIDESLLPPIYYTRRSKDFMISPVKKPSSSAAANAAAAAAASAALGANAAAASKMVKVENILMTRPLFDKPSTALIKLRKDIKTQKLKGWPNYKLETTKSVPSLANELYLKKDDWLIGDDFAILHVSFHSRQSLGPDSEWSTVMICVSCRLCK